MSCSCALKIRLGRKNGSAKEPTSWWRFLGAEPSRDLETKRLEYARAGIPECWIVDPEEETITVLLLKSRRKPYIEHGTFAKGTRTTSKVLPGFSVDVTETFSRRP